MKRSCSLVIILFLVCQIPAQESIERPHLNRPRSRRTMIPAPSYPATADSDGNHVNAHGGCIIAYGNEWLWYGEARPLHGFTSEGVSLYTAPMGTQPISVADSLAASPLNLHWKNRGLVLTVVDEEGSPIERGCIIERPKVIYNERTKQFVMLFHSELKGHGYDAAQTGFATSDSPYGPFRLHHVQRPNSGRWPADFSEEDIKRAQALAPEDFKEWWTPTWHSAVEQGLFLARDLKSGQMSRDMTVFVDDDGTAWHIYSSEENLTIQAAELTPDYLGYTGRYYRIAPGGQNEAPCLLKHGDTYRLICSGCTGWTPNEARMFSAKSIQGPWMQHPSPMRGPDADRTFEAQGTWIWAQPSDSSMDSYSFFFMADVWMPRSLAISRHLCLPIAFEEGMPVIRKQARTSLE